MCNNNRKHERPNQFSSVSLLFLLLFAFPQPHHGTLSFAGAIAVPVPANATERRGFHFVTTLPPMTPLGAGAAVACGILGELVAVSFAGARANISSASVTSVNANRVNPNRVKSHSVTHSNANLRNANRSGADTNSVTRSAGGGRQPQLLYSHGGWPQWRQARTVLYTPAGDMRNTATLLLGAASFFQLNVASGAVVANVSVPSTALPGDAGLNGLALLDLPSGKRYVLGAAMPGLLVLLNLTGSAAPRSLGAFVQTPHRTYDVALLRPPAGREVHAVTVDASGKEDSLLRVVRLTAGSGTRLLPVTEWVDVGVLPNPHGYGGCNRVRIVADSVAVFSCFKGNVVGFADLTTPSAPQLLATVPFVDEQPTGAVKRAGQNGTLCSSTSV